MSHAFYRILTTLMAVHREFIAIEVGNIIMNNPKQKVNSIIRGLGGISRL